MGPVLASVGMTDDEFLTAFHSLTLEASQFRHGDHLRLAWLHLERAPFPAALENVRTGIQAFAAHHGAKGLYHETITRAWVHLLASHDEPNFAEFLSRHSHRLNKDLLHSFWSPAALDSEEARRSWLAPDLRNLPATAVPS
jgi:hypothetical protein